jgi:serine/threonine protein kinase
MGTPGYGAPEQFEPETALTAAADVYAVGGVMYFAVSGVDPWVGVSERQVYERMRAGTRPALSDGVRQRCSAEYVALMNRCWAVQAEQRPSIELVYEELQRLQARFFAPFAGGDSTLRVLAVPSPTPAPPAPAASSSAAAAGVPAPAPSPSPSPAASHASATSNSSGSSSAADGSAASAQQQSAASLDALDEPVPVKSADHAM